MRRFEKDKADEPVTFTIRFLEPPDEKDKKGRKDTTFVESAGFRILDKAGLVWILEGPLSSVYRLLEYDGIVFYQIASHQPGVTIKETVPFSRGTMGDGTDNVSKSPAPETPRAIPFQKKPPPTELPATPTTTEGK
jgi:hypothetical protein